MKLTYGPTKQALHVDTILGRWGTKCFTPVCWLCQDDGLGYTWPSKFNYLIFILRSVANGCLLIQGRKPGNRWSADYYFKFWQKANTDIDELIELDFRPDGFTGPYYCHLQPELQTIINRLRQAQKDN